MKAVRSIQCECDDWTLWEVEIGELCPWVCPNCGRIYTLDGRILDPIEGDEPDHKKHKKLEASHAES